MNGMPIGKNDQIGRLRYWQKEVKRLEAVKFPSEQQAQRLIVAWGYVKVMCEYLDAAFDEPKQGNLL